MKTNVQFWSYFTQFFLDGEMFQTNLTDYILITNFCALIIIYSKNINLLYMFRASSAHLQEDTFVHMQHMVLSLSMRVPGGL